jgi:hypothetical protein
MLVPIPLRGDFEAARLRGLARKTKDGPQAWRLLALAAIYDGATRTEAAKIGGVHAINDYCGSNWLLATISSRRRPSWQFFGYFGSTKKININGASKRDQHGIAGAR